MRKVTVPNFCINFLNKAEKSLPILYDFAVAPLTGAWIKICPPCLFNSLAQSHPSRVRGLKFCIILIIPNFFSRTPHGCVD